MAILSSLNELFQEIFVFNSIRVVLLLFFLAVVSYFIIDLLYVFIILFIGLFVLMYHTYNKVVYNKNW